MQLHLPTIFVVSQLISLACGLVFLLGPRTTKSPLYVWFAGAFLSAPCATVFYLLAERGEEWLWAHPAGNAIATLAIALIWVGARSVNGRSLPLRTAFLVPAVIMVRGLDDRHAERAVDRGIAVLSLLQRLLRACGPGVRARRDRRAVARSRQGADRGVRDQLRLVPGESGWIGRAGHGHPVFLSVLGAENAATMLTVMIVVASLGLSAIAKERALRTAHRLATEDPLTGLLNRREFTRRAEELSASAGGRQNDYAVLLFDLDHFKSINDTYGHMVGDEVLEAFARVARRALREGDLLCRYGGEEFAALLPGATADGALRVADRIHRGLATSVERVFSRVRPTTSIGVASVRSAEIPLGALLRRADVALYRAKEEGRNRTVVFDDTSLQATGTFRTGAGAHQASA